jgi:protein-S-isoprenylcysteine O-methyltransferase Ste14
MKNLPNLLSLIFLVSEIIILILKRSKSAEVKIRKDKSTMLLLWIVISLSLFAGGYISKMYPYEGDHPWILYSGITIMILGFIIRWTAVIQLGKAFTVDVSISKTHKIKDDGLYKLIRHPSYSGLVMIFFGLSLLFGSWYGILVVNIPIFIALGVRIKAEEELLESAFGDDYKNYKKRTKRIIPGVY